MNIAMPQATQEDFDRFCDAVLAEVSEGPQPAQNRSDISLAHELALAAGRTSVDFQRAISNYQFVVELAIQRKAMLEAALPYHEGHVDHTAALQKRTSFVEFSEGLEREFEATLRAPRDGKVMDCYRQRMLPV